VTEPNLIEAAAAEAVTLTSELIRIDTTNTGDPDTLVGERVAAEYVAEKLTDAGYEITYVESGGKNRHNVIVRLEGAVNAIAVELPRPCFRQVSVPDLIRLLTQSNARRLARRVHRIEETQLHARSVLGKDCEVHARAVPRRP